MVSVLSHYVQVKMVIYFTIIVYVIQICPPLFARAMELSLMSLVLVARIKDPYERADIFIVSSQYWCPNTVMFSDDDDDDYS